LEANDIISSGILELYATGSASVQEVGLVQKYAAQFPKVAEALVKMEIDLEIYANAYAVQPDASVKVKIFARINSDENKVVPLVISEFKAPAKVIEISSYWKYAAAAAIFLLFGSLLVNVLQYNKNDVAIQQLQQTLKELAVIKDDNKIMESDMSVVQNKYSVPVSLHGLDAAPNAEAKIFYLKNTGEVYIDPSNLPDAPSGKQYQLWGIVDGKPVSGGMILTSKRGDKYRIQKMKTFGHAEAFAVTLESEVDNTSPKGPMFVMGKL